MTLFVRFISILIDSVTIYCNDISGFDLLNNSGLSSENDLFTKYGKKYRTYHLNNLSIKAYEDKASLTGSMPIYSYGNNFQDLNRNDFKKAIQSINDNLGFPIDSWRISKLDVAANIELDNLVSDYLNLFGRKSRYDNCNYGNGNITYSNKSKSFTFYDKVIENNNKRTGNIPSDYLNKNILRAELKLKINPSRLLGIPALQVKDLWRKENYNNITKVWYNDFNSIEKYKQGLLIESSDIMSSKGFNNFAKSQLIKQNGVKSIIEKLTYIYKSGEIEYWKYRRRCDEIRAIDNQSIIKPEDDLIAELNSKIEKIVNYQCNI